MEATVHTNSSGHRWARAPFSERAGEAASMHSGSVIVSWYDASGTHLSLQGDEETVIAQVAAIVAAFGQGPSKEQVRAALDACSAALQGAAAESAQVAS